MKPTESIPAPVRTFSVGEAVQFMVTKRHGSGFSFSTREGTITELSKPDGKLAIIKLRNNREIAVMVSDLRKMNEPGPVDEVFRSFVAASQASSPSSPTHQS